MLTNQQHKLLEYIDGVVENEGVPPSFDEMRDHLKLASKSGVHRLVVGLEERGFIRRIPNRSRAMEVLKRPPRKGARLPSAGDVRSVPLMGRIAAGTPVSAIQVPAGAVELPASMLGRGDHFALEIRGDSMVEAGIMDGDTVVIRRQETVSDGEIAVALVDREEATLKRIRLRGPLIELHPANPSYEVRSLERGRVTVQGVLATLVRRY